MIMHDFVNWLEISDKNKETTQEEEFEDFIQHRFIGLSLAEIFCSLAREIYELQVCMEGLIEDQEIGLR